MENAPTRKFIIGGNWKSNGTVDFVRQMCTETLNKMEYDPNHVQVVVAPIMIHIASAKAMLDQKISVAAQNISATKNGAFTGEVSAEQIKDFELQWTLIGHSERRQLYQESNETVAAKVKQAQDNNLSCILCVGETLAEREENRTNEVLKEQLIAVKDVILDWTKIVIAYEPIWAIGTGKVATPEVAQDAHAFIRQWLGDQLSGEVAAQTRIQYGGSVNGANAATLIAQPDIDGFLVGGASLKADFAVIIKAASDYRASLSSL